MKTHKKIAKRHPNGTPTMDAILSRGPHLVIEQGDMFYVSPDQSNPAHAYFEYVGPVPEKLLKKLCELL